MKENYCKRCIHCFIKKITGTSTIEYGCRLEKEVITTIQEPILPGISKTKFFVRPKESKCKDRVIKRKENSNA